MLFTFKSLPANFTDSLHFRHRRKTRPSFKVVLIWAAASKAPCLFDSEGHGQWASASAQLLATLAALHVFAHLEPGLVDA